MTVLKKSILLGIIGFAFTAKNKIKKLSINRGMCSNMSTLDCFTTKHSNFIGISLGYDCTSAVWGKNMRYRETKENGYKTCPFDLMVTNYSGIIACIRDDFKYMCDDKYLEVEEGCVVNTKYNFMFNHESPANKKLSLDEKWAEGIDHFTKDNYKNLKERYTRRINNFKEYLMTENNSIIFIITDAVNDLSELENVIKEKYPNVKFTIARLSKSYWT